MKNKFVIAVLSLFFVLTCALGVTACSSRNNDSTHTHNYVQKYDDSNHWMECSVSGCTEKLKDRANHDTSGVNGACSVCGYKKSEQENPPTPPAHKHTYSEQWASAGAEGHYHLANCEHTDEHTDIVPHVYDNETDTTCNDCGYVREVVIPHTHDLIPTEANAATCTTDGNIEYWYCADCQKYFSDGNGNTEIALADTVIDKLNHDIEHHNGQAATCTVDGWNAYDTCSRCDYTTYQEIGKLGHNYGAWTETKAATCTALGEETRYCSHDNTHTETREIAKLAHTPSDWITDAAATCEVAGSKHKECTVCYTELETETIAALGHDYGAWTKTRAATCTALGEETRYCSHDNSHTETREIVKLAHTPSDWIIDTAATCEVAGSKHKECTVCHTELETETIVAHGHNYGAWTETKAATCTVLGEETRYCSHDNSHTETRDIAKLAHTPSDWIEDIAATCEVAGSKHKECTVCHTEIETGSIDALGHDYGAWTETRAATCTALGEETRYCSHDNSHTETRDIAKLAHTQGNVQEIVNPTCTEQGYTVYVCEVCNEEFASNYIAALGHSFDSEWVCIRCGHEYATDGLVYELSQDRTYYTVVGYMGDSAQVVIPAHYNEIPVTAVGAEAFKDNTNIRGVFLSISMQFIGESAFGGCTALSSINLRNNITSIGFAALQNTAFTSLSIPFVGTSKDGTDNTHFGYIFGASSYSDNSKYVPSSLKTVIIKYGTSIGSYAFYCCNSLTSITIPNSVTSIGRSVFNGCSSLKSITLPFVGATKDGTSNTHFGYIFGASSYSDNANFVPSSVRTVIITGDTSIGGSAFTNCSSLVSVTIGNGMTSIGYGAFDNCRSLMSITIPDSVTSIGKEAFSGCRNLMSITIPDSVTSIGEGAFHLCPIRMATIPAIACGKIGGLELKTVIITGGTSIESDAFSGCSSLTSITIPNSVTSIGYNAFTNCSSLTSVTIPDSVTSIGHEAFGGCSSLTSITLPFVGASKDGTSYTNFGYIFGAYRYSDNSKYVPLSLKTVIITGDTSIGGSAFYGCSSLESITLPFVGASKDGTSNTHFGYIFGASIYPDNADFVPSSLKTVIITGGTSIGEYAFRNCIGLTSVTIPNSVTSIGEYAFSGCSSLTSITIPNSVTSIGHEAFGSCSSLESITVSEDNVDYVSQDGILYNKAKTQFIHIPKAIKGAVTIPNSVTSIGEYAFYNCIGLTSITISDGVTSIGQNAFDRCYNLKYNIYDNAYYLGNDTNKYVALIKAKDTSITSCKIHENTEVIADCAFFGCSNLTSITIPDGVTSIGNVAFSGCSSLTSITIPNGVTYIGRYAFNNCSSLTSIEIPNGVTSIGYNAFNGCSKLTIFCEATEKPSGWDGSWNSSCPVVWSYKIS